MRKTIAAILTLAVSVGSVGAVRADDYPARRVQITVAWPAGGGSDLIARVLAEQLTKQTGQPFVIENKGGANGLIGSESVSAAKPDGYTLLFTNVTQANLENVTPDLTFDVQKDLTPISMVAASPYLMAISPTIPAKTPKELADWIKANPGKFRWAVGGKADAGYYGVLQFNKMAGIDAPVVLYSGSSDIVRATLSGEVQGMIQGAPSLMSYVQGGQLTGLGIGSPDPSPLIPNIPTIASFGFPNYQVMAWFALWGPKDMAPDVAEKVRSQVEKALAAPEVAEKFKKLAVEARPSKSTTEFADYFKSQIDWFADLSKDMPK